MKLAFIGSGPNGADRRWTRGFFTKLAEKGENFFRNLYGWALHYYCGSTGKKVSTDYTTDEWYELLGKSDRMESLIIDHWSVMGEIDTRRQVKLINTIHSLFLAYEDKFIATPNYHVFEMYSAHQGGTSVRTVFSAPRVSYTVPEKANSLWGLQGSASLHDKQLVLTVVNPHHNQARETEIAIRGASIGSCQSKVLSSTDIHAHNSFTNPRALEPNADVNISGSTFVYQFLPASVTRLQISLA